jgi:hypothetical protein
LPVWFWQDGCMSLEKPPPSRYSVEEKNGLLIVHDSMAGTKASSPPPDAQPRSALDGVNRAAPAAPSPVRPTTIDAGKAKRSGTLVVIVIVLVFFLIFTGLWPIMVIALLVPPVRRQLLGAAMPALKRYIEEGRAG